MFGDINQNLFDRVMAQLGNINNNEQVDILLGSTGGTTEVGIRLYEYLMCHVNNLTIIGIGDVSSIAVPVFLAGKTRLITKNAKIIIHASSMTINAEINLIKLREFEDSMLSDAERISNIFNERTKGAQVPLDIRDTLYCKENSIVLSAKEAVRHGIATGIAPISL